jgi:hypothetical protein
VGGSPYVIMTAVVLNFDVCARTLPFATIQFQPVMHNFKSHQRCDFCLQLLNAIRLELHDFAGIKINNMIMMGFVDTFISGSSAFKAVASGGGIHRFSSAPLSLLAKANADDHARIRAFG